MVNATFHQILVGQAAAAVKADALKVRQHLAAVAMKEVANVAENAEATVNQVVTVEVARVLQVQIAVAVIVQAVQVQIAVAAVVQADQDNNISKE